MSIVFNVADPEVLHIECNNICNASCPQCARYDLDGNINLNIFNQGELTVDVIESRLPISLINGLKKLLICGPVSDPAASSHLKSIIKWFRKLNPDIVVGMNTNGSLKSTEWWADLGKLLNRPYDYVVWSIDGLEDTNHIYRRGTKWSKIIENAKAFIAAGGSAHWDMLVFKHNSHQVDAAISLARDLGFSWFRSKVSNRFEEFPISWVQPPEKYDQESSIFSNKIECEAISQKILYMDSNGTFYPCCYFATESLSQLNTSRDQIKNLLKLNDRPSIDKISHSNLWQPIISSWDHLPSETCKKYCSINHNGTRRAKSQWTREIQL